jgi:hypothetical protein
MRYFFHIDDRVAQTEDRVGAEFRELKEVRREAHRILAEIAGHELNADGQKVSVDVQVASGEWVYRATLTITGVSNHE